MQPTSTSSNPRTADENTTPETVEMYYMDTRHGDSPVPESETMYSYTPTIQDLMDSYTKTGEYLAYTLSDAYKTWNDMNDENALPNAVWRSLNVGDILIFDGEPFIIRPAGYDKLSIAIGETSP